ncbi:MAG: sensor histidine kinase [Campylobacterales bacterium]
MERSILSDASLKFELIQKELSNGTSKADLEGFISPFLSSDSADMALVDKTGVIFSNSDFNVSDFFDNTSLHDKVSWRDSYAYFATALISGMDKQKVVAIIKSKDNLDIISRQIMKIFYLFVALLIPLTLIISYALSATYSRLISDLERKEQVVLQERKLAEIGGLLSFISHQWRQPLNIIAATIMEIKSHLYTQKIDRDKIDVLLDKNEDILIELTNMLELTKSYYNPYCNDESFTLKSVFEATFALLNSRAANIELHEEVDKDITIKGNKSELIQCLLSVINNSLDAFEHRDIEYRKLYIQGKKENGYIKIVIKDNAGGLDKEIEKNIFEKYSTTKGEKGGSGIGLYFTKMTIEDMFDGKIKISSKNNSTTTEMTIKSL